MHRRVRPRDRGLVSEAPWRPARLLAQLTDPDGLQVADLAGGVVRAAGALRQTRERQPVLWGRGAPARHPPPDRRCRDIPAGRGPRERLALQDHMTGNIPPAERGEAGSMVRHPGLLEGVSFDTHTLSAGPDLHLPHSIRNVPGHVS